MIEKRRKAAFYAAFLFSCLQYACIFHFDKFSVNLNRVSLEKNGLLKRNNQMESMITQLQRENQRLRSITQEQSANTRRLMSMIDRSQTILADWKSHAENSVSSARKMRDELSDTVREKEKLATANEELMGRIQQLQQKNEELTNICFQWSNKFSELSKALSLLDH